MDKSSLKSSNIECRFLHLVSREGDLNNCVHPFIHGPTLPVAIFVGLHLIEVRVGADHFVHWFVCSTGRLVLQRSRCRVPPRLRVSLLPPTRLPCHPPPVPSSDLDRPYHLGCSRLSRRHR